MRKAKQLLAEAGYPNGFETPCYNLITPREPNVKEMGEAVFAYLGTVGIRCKVQGLEYSAWINLGRARAQRAAGDGRRPDVDVGPRPARRSGDAVGRPPAQLRRRARATAATRSTTMRRPMRWSRS